MSKLARLMRTGPLAKAPEGELCEVGAGPKLRWAGAPGASGAGWPVGTALSPKSVPKGDPPPSGCEVAAAGVAPKGEAAGAGAEKGDAGAGDCAAGASAFMLNGEPPAGAVPKGFEAKPIGAAAKGELAGTAVISAPAAANGVTGKAGAPGRES